MKTTPIEVNFLLWKKSHFLLGHFEIFVNIFMVGGGGGIC